MGDRDGEALAGAEMHKVRPRVEGVDETGKQGEDDKAKERKMTDPKALAEEIARDCIKHSSRIDHGPYFSLVTSDKAIKRTAARLAAFADEVRRLARPEWISVKERLPDCPECKLRHLGWLVLNMDEIEITYIHPGWWAEELGEVTHWMPLPAHPATEKGE